MLKRKLENPSKSDGTRPAKAHRQTFSGVPTGSSIHGRTKITTHAPSRAIPNGTTQMGGVMMPNTSAQVQKKQQIRALIKALYHNNIHQQNGLKKLFKYLGFDIDLLSPSPTARTPRQLDIPTGSGDTRSSATPREHNFRLFQAIQAAQTSNQDPEQILKLIRETFVYLYKPENQTLLARLMQQTNPQTLQALFSPFQVEHGRASLYQFTQDGYMDLIILHLPKANLSTLIDRLISPHILHADSRSFKKLIEHLDSRAFLKPEEAPFINTQVKRLFDTALQYHTGHCHVHDELSSLYDRFKNKYRRAAQTTSIDMHEEEVQARAAALG